MNKAKIYDAGCVAIAFVLYALSKIKLARKPHYSNCIGEWITCGYKVDKNGFFKFPLYKLARRFEKELESKL